MQVIVAERGDCELVVDPRCFLSDGHFAGPDAGAARGVARGDGGPRALQRGVVPRAAATAPTASPKPRSSTCRRPRAARTYSGYSDAGSSARPAFTSWGSALHGGRRPRTSCARVATPPSTARRLAVRRDLTALERDLKAPAMAFNLTVLSNLLGNAALSRLHRGRSGRSRTPTSISTWIDCMMFHVTASPNISLCRQAAARGGRAFSKTTVYLHGRRGDRRGLARGGVRASSPAVAPTSGTTSDVVAPFGLDSQERISPQGHCKGPQSASIKRTGGLEWHKAHVRQGGLCRFQPSVNLAKTTGSALLCEPGRFENMGRHSKNKLQLQTNGKIERTRRQADLWGRIESTCSK